MWTTGQNATIIYTVTVPDGTSGGKYDISGTISGYGIASTTVNGTSYINVTGTKKNTPSISFPMIIAVIVLCILVVTFTQKRVKPP
jgi:hypothetical protein